MRFIFWIMISSLSYIYMKLCPVNPITRDAERWHISITADTSRNGFWSQNYKPVMWRAGDVFHNHLMSNNWLTGLRFNFSTYLESEGLGSVHNPTNPCKVTICQEKVPVKACRIPQSILQWNVLWKEKDFYFLYTKHFITFQDKTFVLFFISHFKLSIILWMVEHLLQFTWKWNH